MVQKTQAKVEQKDVKEPTAATQSKTKKKERKKYTVTFFHKWCKTCGICSALCVKQIIKVDETGVPYIHDMDSCTGCRFCEIHCPDFAITINERYPHRRLDNGND